jgi:hypothetical protein
MRERWMGMKSSSGNEHDGNASNKVDDIGGTA